LSEPKDVTIYTRGVSSVTGAGGYAAILLYKGRRKEFSGGEPVASNNRMDLRAAIEGLRALKQPCRVVLYNNNTYLVDAIAKGWAAGWRARGWANGEKKPTPHVDLWEELLTLCAAHELSFVYRPFGGHDRELSRCDLLAREAARSFERPMVRGARRAAATRSPAAAAEPGHRTATTRRRLASAPRRDGLDGGGTTHG
jgi:ribonuclease HI